ncbi:uncharacterized protein LOC144371780 [Ictidomys tridecemlineatus]
MPPSPHSMIYGQSLTAAEGVEEEEEQDAQKEVITEVRVKRKRLDNGSDPLWQCWAAVTAVSHSASQPGDHEGIMKDMENDNHPRLCDPEGGRERGSFPNKSFLFQ